MIALEFFMRVPVSSRMAVICPRPDLNKTYAALEQLLYLTELVDSQSLDAAYVKGTCDCGVRKRSRRRAGV